MAVVISNRGRLISDLTQAGTLGAGDLLIIQSVNASTNATRKTTLGDLKTFVLGTLDGYAGAIDFQNVGNKFTGAFYNPTNGTSNLYNVTIRSGGSLTIGTGTTATISPSNLTFVPLNGSSFQTKIVNTSGGITGSASTGLTGSLKGKLIGNVTGNVAGNLTGNVTGNVAGNVTGNLNGNLTGNAVGNLTGDVYNANSNKVLENGSGSPTSNGGIPNAFFYGTSSYATQALTAAYAAAGTGGLPGGGSAYQIVSKDASNNATWTTQITRSGAPSTNYLPYWTDNKTLAGSSMLYTPVSNTLNLSSITATSVTSSLLGVITSPPSEVSITAVSTYTLNGDLYPSNVLHVSASGATINLNLRKGRTCTVLIKNGGAYSISTWNASINGGVSTTSLYWKNGSAPTITSGAGKKDVFTFVNINNYVLGSAVQNFS
jgi:hypothetical protein